MQDSFKIINYHFATLRFDETQVNGYGTAAAPRLILQLRLDVAYPKISSGRKIEFMQMSGKLKFGHQLWIDAVPALLSLTISTAHPSYPELQVNMEFPTTPAVIAELEQLRAGGNLKAQLWATVEYVEMQNTANPEQTDVWAIVQRHQSTVTPHLEFPSSSWISRVLPNIGYGVIHVLEFPAAPLEEHQNFKDAFTALSQARNFHFTGHYNDVAARCRMALEKFMEHVEVPDGKKKTKKIHRLKISWQTRLGKATYDWLNSCFSTSKIAANPTAHSPNQHFDQLESQMILAITTALVAYAARSSSSGQQK